MPAQAPQMRVTSPLASRFIRRPRGPVRSAAWLRLESRLAALHLRANRHHRLERGVAVGLERLFHFDSAMGVYLVPWRRGDFQPLAGLGRRDVPHVAAVLARDHVMAMLAGNHVMAMMPVMSDVVAMPFDLKGRHRLALGLGRCIG